MKANRKKSRWALFSVVLILSFWSLLSPGFASAQTDNKALYNAGDPSFFYFGRHQHAENVLLTWPGSGLRVGYTNSRTVTLRIFADNFKEDASFTVGRVIWYKVDRGPWLQFKLGGGEEKDVALTVPNDLNHHTLDVVKASEGQLTFKAILLDKGGTLSAPPLPSRRIEVIGDSISAGFKIYGLGNFEAPGFHDAKASFGWVLGSKLDAEVRLIAITTRGVVHNFGQNAAESKTMTVYYPELQRQYDIPNDWSWQPEYIIINLGTNDMAPPGETPPADFQGAYTNLLAMVRNYNPKAIILAMEPFGTRGGAEPVYPKQVEGAVALRRAAGDTKVAFINTEGWLGSSDFTDGVHPNAYGHLKAATRLLSLIRNFDAGGTLPGPAVTIKPTPTSAHTASTGGASVDCPGAPLTRLLVGQQARVAADGRGPSPIFDKPGGRRIASVPEGTVLKLFDGPRCYVRALFWLVYLPDGRAGWINEGDHAAYYIEPYSGN